MERERVYARGFSGEVEILPTIVEEPYVTRDTSVR